jgi:tetratricopeptide (TPR) repeat protein
MLDRLHRHRQHYYGHFDRCILWPVGLRMPMLNARVVRCMAVTDCNALPCASRFTAVPIALLAIVLTFPLGGCSFDLGSWGSDKEKPQAADQKPTGTISGQSASDAQGYAARGQALAKSGKTEEAQAEFDRALTLDPYNVQALYGRGLIHQADKQHEQAIVDFTAANGLTPQRVEPLLARATSYLAIDKTKEAASDLDEAVQADPNSAQAWSARGVTYERLGDKAKAFASYGRALALRPRDEAARSGLARTGG